MWIGGLWIFLTASFGQIVPQLMGRAVDGLFSNAQASHLGLWCWGIVSVALIQGCFRYRMRRDIIGASRHIEYDLRRHLYAHLLRLSPAYYGRTRTGDLMTRCSSDLEAVRQVVGPAFMYFSNTFLIVTSSLVLMLIIDVPLTLLAVLPLTLLSIVVRVLGRRIHSRTLEVQAQESQMAARVQETLSGIRVVKSYVQQQHELEAFRLEATRLVDRNMRLVRIWGLFFPLMALIVGVGAILTLWLGGHRVIQQDITIGDFVAFSAYLTRLAWPMISIGWVINLVERGAASMKRINEILNTEPKIQDGPRRIKQGFNGNIEFRDVSFSYADGPKVLQNINLKIQAGETLAIVGPTGSGKTTLVELVARFYDVTSGQILIDGVDLREFHLRSLRDHIGMVPQDTFLFSDTLSGNIEFGFPERSSTSNDGTSKDRKAPGDPQNDLLGSDFSRIQEATQLAQLNTTDTEFPEGLATRVGERGITLSGGQKQRTTIARAILRRPQILLLDDCLSSVDTYTEEEILKHLRKVMHNCTAMIVAHRMSTVRNADRVIVLQEGSIVEAGTHSELVEQRGYYARLVEKQQLQESLDRDGASGKEGVED